MYFDVLSTIYDKRQVHLSKHKICIQFYAPVSHETVQNLITHDFLSKKFSFSLDFDHMGAYYHYHLEDDINLVRCDYTLDWIYLEIALKKPETM